jgi:ketosteroid isomerase-like protein
MAVAIDFEIVDRTVREDLAVDVGYYTLTTTPAAESGERPGRSVGKFVTVAAPEADGRWRFRVDAYNTAPEEVLDPGPEPVAAHPAPATPSP